MTPTPPPDGGAAFPTADYQSKGMGLDEATQLYRYAGPHPGMTLRDYFAGQALAGMTSGSSPSVYTAESLAAAAYRYADAMITARGAPVDFGHPEGH